ncbi:MAG: hypothetical protein IJL38_02350 [Bacteroidales bacterium]|nr:hypothetical protein [Bacteroidales bacterium]
MKKILAVALMVGVLVPLMAQNTGSKKERKKNLVVKEWNLKAGSQTPFLDNVVTYDEMGRKVEEIEYASYGQKYRIVFEYEGKNTKCSREVEYNDKNKVVSIKKFEYNADGTKSKQYTYLPNGKLKSTKIYERITREQ